MSTDGDGPVWTVWVPGTPRAWARHGAGGVTRESDRRWRITVRHAWLSTHGCLNLRQPAMATLVFVGADGRADLDNLCKAVLEALSRWPTDGVAPAWHNDVQVMDLWARKLPAPSRCDAGLFVCVRPYSPSAC